MPQESDSDSSDDDGMDSSNDGHMSPASLSTSASVIDVTGDRHPLDQLLDPLTRIPLLDKNERRSMTFSIICKLRTPIHPYCIQF